MRPSHVSPAGPGSSTILSGRRESTRSSRGRTPRSPLADALVDGPGHQFPTCAVVERQRRAQIGADWGVSASYLGSYSDRLWGLIALNPGVYMGLGPCTLQDRSFPVCTTSGNLNQRRVLSVSGENPASALLIANLDSHAAVGFQKYRGLKLSMQRRSTARREHQ